MLGVMLACPRCGSEDGSDGLYAVRECARCGLEFRPPARVPLRPLSEQDQIIGFFVELARDLWNDFPLTLARLIFAHAPIVIFFAMLGMGIGLCLAYVDRGPWYADYGEPWSMFVAVVVVALGSSKASAVLLDAKARRRPIRWRAPALVVLAALVFLGIRWFYPAPSIAGGYAALELGELERAEIELYALALEDPDAAELAELREAIARARARRHARALPERPPTISARESASE